jgi:hypothetical protein
MTLHAGGLARRRKNAADERVMAHSSADDVRSMVWLAETAIASGTVSRSIWRPPPGSADSGPGAQLVIVFGSGQHAQGTRSESPHRRHSAPRETLLKSPQVPNVSISPHTNASKGPASSRRARGTLANARGRSPRRHSPACSEGRRSRA